MRAGEQDYCLTESALSYMKDKKLPLDSLLKIQQHKGQTFSCQEKWLAWLKEHAITNTQHQRFTREGALLGSILQHGLCHDLAIVSDGAGQYNGMKKWVINGRVATFNMPDCHDSYGFFKNPIISCGILP